MPYEEGCNLTVSAESNKVTYAGNGSTTSFSTVFTFAANDEVTVTKVVTSTGVETEFTLGTEYTLTGAGTGSAGTVTISTSPSDYTPASGTKLVVQLKPDFTQTTDLPRGGTVSPADTLEPMHDSRVRQMLRLKDDVDRSLKLPIDETSAAVLQNATLRAGKILSFDGTTGAPITTQEFGTFRGNWAASTAYVARDLVKDTSTNNIFQAKTAHTSSGAQPLTTNTDSAKWDLIVDAGSATTSATAAAASATTATSQAVISTAQAVTSTTKASEASASAASAASSQSSASSSASTATTKASEASASATAAAASAASAAVTITSQAKAEAGTDNGELMTPLRTKQAVDSYGVITADDVATTGANKILKLDGSGALGAVSGAALTNLPASGGTIDLTTSGAVTAGKCLVLNSNSTVSEIAVTSITQLIGSSFTPSGETVSGAGRIVYMTTPDRFFLAHRASISGSLAVYARVLDLSASMAISDIASATLAGSQDVYSCDYSATHDRVSIHQQDTSPHGVGVYTASYSSSNGLDVDGKSVVHSSNLPYGSSMFVGASDHAILSTFQNISSVSTVYGKFWTLTTGSDATADSMAGGSDFDLGIPSSSGSYHYYSTPVWFSGPSKLMVIKTEYHGATDYRTHLTHGTISGTGSSASYSEDGEASWSDTDMFVEPGKVRYDAGLDRAIWFDGKFLRTISLTGGYAQSALQTIQTNYPGSTLPAKAMGVIPGTNYICLFAPDAANSNRVTMWVVTITKGGTAAADTFSVASPVQISTDAMDYYADVAWSPDAGGFLLYTQVGSAAGKSYGIRPAQTSTNVTSSNFIGFAQASAGDGATVTVQLPGATATPAQGSLTAGTTYYVSNSGAIQTTNAGYGKAGRAVSSTKLIIEERA